ncbi:hypothetical protein EPO56_00615 [Patescibacteria group bacterium]|nr:MAG: hypothetical protein EPO56_00615 [Patescibacteria group bacterium]
MSEKRRKTSEVSSTRVDEGFRIYLSPCPSGGNHDWTHEKDSVEVRTQGHVRINHCTKCKAESNTPLSI